MKVTIKTTKGHPIKLGLSITKGELKRQAKRLRHAIEEFNILEQWVKVSSEPATKTEERRRKERVDPSRAGAGAEGQVR